MQPGDRLLCAFVEQPDQSAQFTEWPLHVTIMPWFRTEISSDQLADELCDCLCEFKPFQVVMSDETKFGHDKIVNLVAQPTLLMEVEEQTRAVIKRHTAWLVDETTKRRREYSPHVTAQKEERLYRGDTFICNAIYIVEQKGSHKISVAKIEL